MGKSENTRSKSIKLGPVSPEALEIITMVARQMGPRYLFPGRDRDDMVQQGILFGLAAFPKWDGVRPLENFMRVHMKRRYLNYIRDNYCRYEKSTDPDRAARLAEMNKARQNLMSPVDVEEVGHMVTTKGGAHDDVAYDELIDFIKDRLPVKLRGDFLRMIDEVHISAARKEEVRAAVSVILEEYNGESDENSETKDESD